MFEGKKIGVIGAGNMAEVLIRGVLKAGLVEPGVITACDLSEDRRNVFAEMGCLVSSNICDIMDSDIVLLALKPQVLPTLLADIGREFTNEQLLISIAAGVTITAIQQAAVSARIVRVMPNTPMLVGEGVSGIAKGRSANSNDIEMALALFGSAGDAYEVEESQIDAVTGLSGSGPAYLFYFAEVLAAAGREAGLPEELAEKMACKTVTGAAKLLAESSDSAEILRRKVTSPNGTTEAAIKIMQERGLRDVIVAGVLRAKERSEELARGE